MSHDELITYNRNGNNFIFDIADADEAEKYEKAINRMGEAEKAMPKDGSVSAIYRAQCKCLRTFFDDVLGASAGVKICGEKDNVTICYDAYIDFLKFVSAQRDHILDTRNAMRDLSPKRPSNGQPIPIQRNNPPASKNHQQKNNHRH